jgi:hypothetical protein
MNEIIAWFKSKNITAHVLAGLAITAATVITSDQQVQQFLVAVLKAHPAAAADIVLAAGIIAKYTHSSSPAGTLATANEIKSQPDAPTAAQVDAATVSK